MFCAGMRRRGPALTLAALVVSLAVAAPATAGKAKLRLPLGHSLAAGIAQLRFKGPAPRTIRLRTASAAALAPSYRGLYAVYRKRRDRTTTLTFFTLLLHQEKTAARSLLADPADRDDGLQLALFFSQFGLGPSVTTISTSVDPGEPTRLAPRAARLLSGGGVDVSAGVQGGDLGDSVVDTGHYDDGHSFGWNSAGTGKALGNWLHLTADNAPYEELIEKLERSLSADLDGDGDAGSGRSGGSVDTVVEPPVITQP